MNVHILGQPKKRCNICDRPAHPFTTRCDYNTLVDRVAKLLEVNKDIPFILRANKEAVDTAMAFQTLVRDADIVIETCKKHLLAQPNGEELWANCEKEFEACLKTLHPAIEENQNPSSQENTIQSGIENKQCTEEMILGGTTAPDSSASILSATLAEKKPPLLIT